jgi:hypothetical protein
MRYDLEPHRPVPSHVRQLAGGWPTDRQAAQQKRPGAEPKLLGTVVAGAANSLDRGDLLVDMRRYRSEPAFASEFAHCGPDMFQARKLEQAADA